MFCKYCGETNEDDARFCEKCGRNLHDGYMTVHTRTSYFQDAWDKAGRLFYSLPLIVSGIMSAIAGFFVYSYKDNNMPSGSAKYVVDSFAEYSENIKRESRALDAAWDVMHNYENFWIAAAILVVAGIVIAIVQPKIKNNVIRVLLWIVPIVAIAIYYHMTMDPMTHYVNTYGI